MAHTITITRLPDDTHDDAEYETAGSCDSWCEVWSRCQDETCRRRVVTEAELDAQEAVWHGVEHRHLFEFGWSARTGECGLDFCHDLGMEAQMAEAVGTYALDVEWDGDDWVATIGAVVPASPNSGDQNV